MNADHDHADTTAANTDADPKVPGRGDDERENREHSAKTGESATDALGNADGAS